MKCFRPRFDVTNVHPRNGELTQTDRTRLRRKAERGRFDRASVNAILDEAIFCTVAFAAGGRPWAVPMVYGRIHDTLYLHGNVTNHLLTAMADGVEVCVSVTLVDAVVFARSLFRQSVDYRSVMLFGRASEVTDDAERLRALEAVVEHVIPGRSDDVRPPSKTELSATRVVRVPIIEGSAKIRDLGPVDLPDDVGLPIWAGRVPLEHRAGRPLPADDVCAGIAPPSYAANYARPRAHVSGG
jgi:nitroimidazol reductase NimA-like FMN-containing flavoprotein (pyridoxamine 5'-phosphate oxidase superfamily)